MPLSPEDLAAYDMYNRQDQDEERKQKMLEENGNPQFSQGSMTSAINKYNYNRQREHLNSLMAREQMAQGYQQAASQRALAQAQMKNMANEHRRGLMGIGVQNRQLAQQALQHRQTLSHQTRSEAATRAFQRGEGRATREQASAFQKQNLASQARLQAGQIASQEGMHQRGLESQQALQTESLTTQVAMDTRRLQEQREREAAEQGNRALMQQQLLNTQNAQETAKIQEAQRSQTASHEFARGESALAHERQSAAELARQGFEREQSQAQIDAARASQARGFEHTETMQGKTDRQARTLAAINNDAAMRREQMGYVHQDDQRQKEYAHQDTTLRAQQEHAAEQANLTRTEGARQFNVGQEQRAREAEDVKTAAADRLGLDTQRFEEEKKQNLLNQIRTVEQDTLNEQYRRHEITHAEWIAKSNNMLSMLKLQINPNAVDDETFAQMPMSPDGSRPTTPQALDWIAGLLHSTDDSAVQAHIRSGQSQAHAHLLATRDRMRDLTSADQRLLVNMFLGRGGYPGV